MSDLNTRFFELANKIEELKEQRKALQDELNKTMADLKIGTMLQNPADGTVYLIEQPTGTFIEFKTIDYSRTKKNGESRGSLAAKTAEEAGFTVPKTTGKAKE